MSDKKRVACFFTGGYTELNAMKSFVERINCNAVYRQLCPIAPRKNRNSIRNRTSIEKVQSGLTGESLVRYVIDTVEKPYFSTEDYDAILIEDDKDERFYDRETSALDIEAWNSFKSSVKQQLNDKGINLPVIFLLASPEIEAWFVADWDNSFGKIFSSLLNGRQNAYFSAVFRKYVKEQILTEKYSEKIEAYGFFGNHYKKLSEEIQTALNTIDFMAEYIPAFEHEPILYSKRNHGEIMLENIDPYSVLHHCNVFFKDGFFELQSLE